MTRQSGAQQGLEWGTAGWLGASSFCLGVYTLHVPPPSLPPPSIGVLCFVPAAAVAAWAAAAACPTAAASAAEVAAAAAGGAAGAAAGANAAGGATAGASGCAPRLVPDWAWEPVQPHEWQRALVRESE